MVWSMRSEHQITGGGFLGSNWLSTCTRHFKNLFSIVVASCYPGCGCEFEKIILVALGPHAA